MFGDEDIMLPMISPNNTIFQENQSKGLKQHKKWLLGFGFTSTLLLIFIVTGVITLIALLPLKEFFQLIVKTKDIENEIESILPVAKQVFTFVQKEEQKIKEAINTVISIQEVLPDIEYDATHLKDIILFLLEHSREIKDFLKFQPELKNFVQQVEPCVNNFCPQN